jgi:hypothetical protein
MPTKKKKDEPRDWQTLHVPFKLDLIREVDEAAERESRNRVNMLAVLVKRGLTVKEGISASA